MWIYIRSYSMCFPNRTIICSKYGIRIEIRLLALWANEPSISLELALIISTINVILAFWGVLKHVRHWSVIKSKRSQYHIHVYNLSAILFRYNARTANWKKFWKYLLELWSFLNAAAVRSITKPYNHALRTKRAHVKLVIWWMESVQTLNRWCPYLGWCCKDNAVFQRKIC